MMTPRFMFLSQDKYVKLKKSFCELRNKKCFISSWKSSIVSSIPKIFSFAEPLSQFAKNSSCEIVEK